MSKRKPKSTEPEVVLLGAVDAMTPPVLEECPACHGMFASVEAHQAETRPTYACTGLAPRAVDIAQARHDHLYEQGEVPRHKRFRKTPSVVEGAKRLGAPDER